MYKTTKEATNKVDLGNCKFIQASGSYNDYVDLLETARIDD